MGEITIQVQDMKDWRTTLLGIATSAAYAGISYYLSGGISWKEALGCAAWAVKCYLSADSANLKSTSDQVQSIITLDIASDGAKAAS